MFYYLKYLSGNEVVFITSTWITIYAFSFKNLFSLQISNYSSRLQIHPFPREKRAKTNLFLDTTKVFKFKIIEEHLRFVVSQFELIDDELTSA